jgi:hypothetical protein
MRTRVRLRLALLCVILVGGAGCAVRAGAHRASDRGRLTLRVRSPWASSNDWRECRLSRVSAGGRELEVIDWIGIGGNSDHEWSLLPGIYCLEEVRTWADRGAGVEGRRGVFVQVEARSRTCVDWGTVRMVSECEQRVR